MPNGKHTPHTQVTTPEHAATATSGHLPPLAQHPPVHPVHTVVEHQPEAAPSEHQPEAVPSGQVHDPVSQSLDRMGALSVVAHDVTQGQGDQRGSSAHVQTERKQQPVHDVVAVEEEKKEAALRKLQRLRQIASEVAPSTGMDCDRWATDFQGALKAAGIPHTPGLFLIREKRVVGGDAIGAQIHLDDKQIGHDSHFFTIVKTSGQEIVFDNLHPEGQPRADYLSRFEFFMERNGKYGPVTRGEHVLEESVPAADVQKYGHVNNAVREARKRAKAPSKPPPRPSSKPPPKPPPEPPPSGTPPEIPSA